MKKLYIKPFTEIEIMEVNPLLAGSGGIDFGDGDEDGTALGKDHNGWSFDEDENNTNAWGDSFSAWD